MNLKKAFSFLEIQLSKNCLIEDVETILRGAPYSDEVTFGFSDIFLYNGVLEATLTKRSAILIKTLDKDGHRKDQTIFVFSFVSFAIDFSCQLLEIYSASKDISKVVQCLNSTFGNKISISTCKTFPSEIIPILNESVTFLEIKSLVINYFKYNRDATGKFSANISNTETGFKLLDEYSKDVIKAILIIILEDAHECYVELNSTGRFTIKCDYEKIDEVLILLKKNINNNG